MRKGVPLIILMAIVSLSASAQAPSSRQEWDAFLIGTWRLLGTISETQSPRSVQPHLPIPAGVIMIREASGEGRVTFGDKREPWSFRWGVIPSEGGSFRVIETYHGGPRERQILSPYEYVPFVVSTTLLSLARVSDEEIDTVSFWERVPSTQEGSGDAKQE
jgi:hypothetical protein